MLNKRGPLCVKQEEILCVKQEEVLCIKQEETFVC